MTHLDPETVVNLQPPVEEKLPKNTQVKIDNRRVIESWVGAIVYLKLEGHPAVEAKIIDVDDEFTTVQVIKETTTKNLGVKKA